MTEILDAADGGERQSYRVELAGDPDAVSDAVRKLLQQREEVSRVEGVTIASKRIDE